ncbi:ascorbate peroxidase 3 [Artemisia annua]|uniref:Ascorbate peroxidase 3 n=1 Tax=Artemisia annua TaxID=35608 RepID=A0A2U1Q393_ARTAN|nr:ascorbate peroxidase 3 [Artemisia annua]
MQAALLKDPGVSVNRLIWSPHGLRFEKVTDAEAALLKDPGVSVNRVIWSPHGLRFEKVTDAEVGSNIISTEISDLIFFSNAFDTVFINKHLVVASDGTMQEFMMLETKAGGPNESIRNEEEYMYGANNGLKIEIDLCDCGKGKGIDEVNNYGYDFATEGLYDSL